MFILAYVSIILAFSQLSFAATNDTCLDITLYDTFGDGWDDAWLFIETPSSQIAPSAPNCTVNPLYKRICGKEEGQYYFMVLNSEDELPDNSWEIVFKVQIESTGEIFTGGFNSTFVFDYHNHHWQLIHYQHMWSNHPNATTCGGSEYIDEGTCLPSPDAPEKVKRDVPSYKPRNVGYIKKDSGRVEKSSAPTASPVPGSMIGKHPRELSGIRSNIKSLTKAPKSRLVRSVGGGGGGDEYSNSTEVVEVPEIDDIDEMETNSTSIDQVEKVEKIVVDRVVRNRVSRNPFSTGRDEYVYVDEDMPESYEMQPQNYTMSPSGVPTGMPTYEEDGVDVNGLVDRETNLVNQITMRVRRSRSIVSGIEQSEGNATVVVDLSPVKPDVDKPELEMATENSTHVEVSKPDIVAISPIIQSPSIKNAEEYVEDVSTNDTASPVAEPTALSYSGKTLVSKLTRKRQNNKASAVSVDLPELYQESSEPSYNETEDVDTATILENATKKRVRNPFSAVVTDIDTSVDVQAEDYESVEMPTNTTASPTGQPTGMPTYEEEGGGGAGVEVAAVAGKAFMNKLNSKREKITRKRTIVQGGGGGGGNDTEIVEDIDYTMPPSYSPTYNYTEEEVGGDVERVILDTFRTRRSGSGFKKQDKSIEKVEVAEMNVTTIEEPELLPEPSNSTESVDASVPGSVNINFRKRHHSKRPHATVNIPADPSVLEEEEVPSETPSVAPTAVPSTSSPTTNGTYVPSVAPSARPSKTPVFSPTKVPIVMFTIDKKEPEKKDAPDLPDQDSPKSGTSQSPTVIPTNMPFSNVTVSPTSSPTSSPTYDEDESDGKKKVALKFKRDKKKAKPIAPAASDSPVELKVTMYDNRGDGWFRIDYMGTMFYITDETKKELLAYGTLENGTYSGYCEYCMGEGSYYFRVAAGTENKDVMWNFCGVNGTYSEQLAFHIDDGKCIPDALLDLQMLCEDTVSSVVSVKVKIAIHGLRSEIFREKDAKVLKKVLAGVVPGWEEDHIDLASSTISLNVTSGHSRALSTYSFVLDMQVSFVPEIAYQYSGTSYNGVKELVTYLEDVLRISAESGEFSSLIRQVSVEEDDLILSAVSETELLSLFMSDITYVGTKTLSYLSSSVEFSESESESLSSDVKFEVVTFNGYHAALFGAVLSIGFVAFVGILVHSLRNRSHESLSSKYVTTSDIDLSISNHYQTALTSNLRNAPSVAL